ncbi:MAG: inositol monophosphatase [Planctomycetes bacterium]|nr:inositol monophosphatase [Planctomycetota bacterium]
MTAAPARTPTSRDLSPALLRRLLASARVSVAEAYALVLRRGVRGVRARRKGVGDFVTTVDLAAERLLRARLLREYPDHGFVGEEQGVHGAGREFVWVIDPIDGTSNFARGIPVFAVSVAVLHRGQPVAAAVRVHPEGATWSAALGLGAFRERRRVRVPRGRLDDGAVLGAQWIRGPHELPFLGVLQDTGARLRVFGCTVAQLVDVACGRLDGNVQEQGRLWDIAAAGLVLTEAGGVLTTWGGAPVFPVQDPASPQHYPTLAAPPKVHRDLLRVLAPLGAPLPVLGDRG